MNILIIKTSSLGDIIQSFPVITMLKKYDSTINIDWVAEKSFCKLLTAHPDIRRVIPVELRKWKKSPFKISLHIQHVIKNIRKEKYQILFDLQGNIKSGLITAISRAKEKVGYDFLSAPEWPNSLFIKYRYKINAKIPIRLQYQSLLQKHLHVEIEPSENSIKLKITSEEERWINEKLTLQSKPFIMVCLGSNWENKKLSLQTWERVLRRLEGKEKPIFFFIWGTDKEHKEVEKLHRFFPTSQILPRMHLPVLQRMMDRMDLIITVDSGTLHLAATTSTSTFSVFGPSNAQIYKPSGLNHIAFQSPCPYGTLFTKRCPLLRTCETGSCMKKVSPESLVDNIKF